MCERFGAGMPYVSSTKSLSGHALGAAGVQEAIYCLLMMKHRFIAGSINIDNLDEKLGGASIVRQTLEEQALSCAVSNSFGFGGTNSCLVLRNWKAAPNSC